MYQLQFSFFYLSSWKINVITDRWSVPLYPSFCMAMKIESLAKAIWCWI